MMSATPAVQINVTDGSANPQAVVMAQIGGIALACSKGILQQDVTLSSGTSNIGFKYPTGLATAKFVFVAAITTSDLIVTFQGGDLSVPYGQGIVLYNILLSDITLSTALGGQVQYVTGG